MSWATFFWRALRNALQKGRLPCLLISPEWCPFFTQRNDETLRDQELLVSCASKEVVGESSRESNLMGSDGRTACLDYRARQGILW